MGAVAGIETKVRGKALELQKREERIVQLEEELKSKIAEVGRTLTLKEEEILNVKKRFKEERLTLEQDKKRLMTQAEELKNRAEAAENKLGTLKREVDESPLSVLRSELAAKNLALIE
jgi:centrosomal protein CEP120